MKVKKLSMLIMAALMVFAAVVFVAADCDNGNGPNGSSNGQTTQLATPVIDFDSVNGLVSWGAVANATGYIFTVVGSSQTATFENNRYEFQLAEHGEFALTLTATSTNPLFSNSNQATRTVNWQEQGNGPQPTQQLAPPTFHIVGNILYWISDEDAIGFEVRFEIDGTPKPVLYGTTFDLFYFTYYYPMPYDETFRVYLRSIGDGVNFSHSVWGYEWWQPQ